MDPITIANELAEIDLVQRDVGVSIARAVTSRAAPAAEDFETFLVLEAARETFQHALCRSMRRASRRRGK